MAREYKYLKYNLLTSPESDLINIPEGLYQEYDLEVLKIPAKVLTINDSTIKDNKNLKVIIYESGENTLYDLSIFDGGVPKEIHINPALKENMPQLKKINIRTKNNIYLDFLNSIESVEERYKVIKEIILNIMKNNPDVLNIPASNPKKIESGCRKLLKTMKNFFIPYNGNDYKSISVLASAEPDVSPATKSDMKSDKSGDIHITEVDRDWSQFTKVLNNTRNNIYLDFFKKVPSLEERFNYINKVMYEIVKNSGDFEDDELNVATKVKLKKMDNFYLPDDSEGYISIADLAKKKSKPTIEKPEKSDVTKKEVIDADVADKESDGE